ncbi:30S ribosomal protein S12 methylthiotransferase RimO [Haliangium ochraceum]|uniref:Ribosomal protein uS12 methylthiotransferase RimO n=1 Tax=Haliangium ochraceum (strain DSM 14365 / JCM 11303 / SMP-2) TaxID=502025 RepID=D0LKI6_HALO1|nr:30S ribosomal protein S12 methylthiotransferase RimO [Haliangium ochraceum]ACY15034.1 MiaB-like tRNA modifying enzyme YliG [Haliangium ochraceum DSM 14365]
MSQSPSASAPTAQDPGAAPAVAPRKVFFVSLGCPKNRVDTEVMLGHAGGAGYRIVAEPDEADVIVVNTCGFIEAAKEESVDTILEMAEYKKQNCEALVVTGCLSQRYPEELAAEIPEIDHLLGSADFRQLNSALGSALSAKAGASPARPARSSLPVIQVSETPSDLYDHTTPRMRSGALHSAYLKIAEGCDRPCSFCIIPKLRGPQRSRSIDSVVAETEALVAGGAREINLIAQDLTRYGADLPAGPDGRPNLAGLLRRVARVPGVRWVRLHYTYPSAFTDELIEVIAEEPTVVKYIDVPLQHIDDEMLKRMRRGHSARVTHELVAKLRQRIDGLVLRTTFIVGHPGETDESFGRLLDFVRETRFERVGAFTYSIEPGTVSGMLPNRVPPEVAEARRDELMALQSEIHRAHNQTLIDREIEVLVDGISDESDLLLQGRWYGQAPEIDGSVYLADGTAQPGDIVRAVVTDCAEYDLAASILEPAGRP